MALADVKGERLKKQHGCGAPAARDAVTGSRAQPVQHGDLVSGIRPMLENAFRSMTLIGLVASPSQAEN
jgi:hypothetical protein